MTRTRKVLTLFGGLMVLGTPLPGTAPLGPTSLAAQVAVGRGRDCDEGQVRGDLGISGLDCRGDCTLTLNDRGQEEFWAFSAEPRILGVARGGPSDGMLQVGDAIVAIDGVLITTAEGGRRFASVEPGQVVRIRVRRGWYDETTEVTVRAGSTCSVPPPSPAPLPSLRSDTTPPPPPPASVTVGRMPPPPPPDTARGAARARAGAGYSAAVAPRIRVTSAGVARAAYDSASSAREPRGVAGLSLLDFPDRTPRARLGIGMSCSDCGTRTDEATGEDVWFFSGPLEVTFVEEGGAADKAGLRIGDLIAAIDGKRLETEAGGRAFSTLETGRPVSLTVIRRNGREVELRAVPQALPDASPADPAEAAPAARPVPPARPTADARVAVGRSAAAVPSAETVSAGAPEGMPLRYSGTMGGVEVEVRGAPASVSEMRGTRTLIIRSNGLWIRIRVPPAGGPGSGG